MSERELESLERELRKLQPARADEDFVSRLVAARPAKTAALPCREVPVREARAAGWWRNLGWWLTPAAAACLALMIWLKPAPEVGQQRLVTNHAAGGDTVPLVPGEVEIEHDLVGSYETVAELPSGVPVRFRLDQWEDTMVYRVPSRGIAVERRTPRLEIVPVSYVSY